MTKLPHYRDIDPLPPPPGSFDRMMHSARARRRRQGLAVLSSVAALVLVASGAFALGSSVNDTQTFAQAGGSAGVGTTTITTTETAGNGTATQQDAAGPATSKPPAAVPAPTGSGTPTDATSSAPPIIALRGHVVDADGAPVVGLLVQPGARNRVVYRSDGRIAAVTDAQGNFDIPCPRAPVLLATWQLDHDAPPPSVGAGWAATFLGPEDAPHPVVPACGKRRTTTVVARGATVSGVVQTVGPCAPDDSFAVQVWLDNNREQSVRLAGLRAGETFTVAGLPAGSHTLAAGGATTALELTQGDVVTQDVTFTCVPDPGASTATSPVTPSADPSPSTTSATDPAPAPSGSLPTAPSGARRSG
jgi:hypothetical protein